MGGVLKGARVFYMVAPYPCVDCRIADLVVRAFIRMSGLLKCGAAYITNNLLVGGLFRNQAPVLSNTNRDNITVNASEFQQMLLDRHSALTVI